jgi:hypothetical protein
MAVIKGKAGDMAGPAGRQGCARIMRSSGIPPQILTGPCSRAQLDGWLLPVKNGMSIDRFYKDHWKNIDDDRMDKHRTMFLWSDTASALYESDTKPYVT